jgi:hypothetical protein
VLDSGQKVNVKPKNLYPAFPPLRINSLPVRGANPVTVWALGLPREIALIVERVPGWRDSRLLPPDAARPYFELVGDVLRLRRITADIGAAAPLVELVVGLGAHGGGRSGPLVSGWYETQTDPMLYTGDENPMIYIRVPDSGGGGGVDWHYFSSGAVNADGVQNTKAFPTIRGARTALRYAHLPRSMRAIGCAMSAAGTPDALLAWRLLLHLTAGRGPPTAGVLFSCSISDHFSQKR